MAEEWILENAHLRMRVASLGGKVQSLYSRHYQAPVLYENPAGGMFPMLPLANRVAGNRFIFQGREIVLPRHHADAHFFLHGDGWLQRWDACYSYVGSMPAVSITWRRSATSCCVTSWWLR